VYAHLPSSFKLLNQPIIIKLCSRSILFRQRSHKPDKFECPTTDKNNVVDSSFCEAMHRIINDKFISRNLMEN
jgi:hypothetical protein